MRFYSILAALLLITFSSQAQQECGQHVIENAERLADPAFDAAFTEADELSKLESNNSNARAETLVIPLVFHVLHQNGPENISDAQIHDCIRSMNLDFNEGNIELDEIIPEFQDNIGNAEVEFRLATLDPTGNPTSGIDRIESNRTFIGDETAKLNIWPRAKYINIWVTDVITVGGVVNGAAAYTRRPFAAQNSPGTDGIITNHRYVGRIGTSSVQRSKTLSHEMGHFFNLKHTWGDSNNPGCDGTSTNPNDPCFGVNNCADDDDVGDTPNTLGVDNGSCNLNASGCSSGTISNVQNFLDYSSCDAMFTKGQVSRMRSALSSSTAQRNQLWMASNLEATGVSVLTAANYYVERSIACRGEFVQFFDESTYEPESWSWELICPSATLTSNEQNPIFEMRDQGIYTVKLTVTQGGVTETIEDVDAFVVSDVYGSAMPFQETFDGENRGWVSTTTRTDNSEYGWKLSKAHGFNDSYSYKMNNYGQESTDGFDLYFSSVDFRPMTAISMNFKVAYARRSSLDGDRLSLSVSDDCGESWTLFWTGISSFMNNGKSNTSSAFSPESASDWISVNVPTIPLSWVSQDAIFRFRFSAGGGNNLYLDDINIDGNYEDVPYLVYPLDQSPNRPNDVNLNWRAVDKSSEYEYELSKSEEFTSLITSGTLATIDDEFSEGADTEYKTEALENGTTYFWRVRAKVGSSMSDWSEVWSFTVDEEGVGVNDLSNASGLSIYPNPTSNRVNVTVNEELQDVSIVIYNLNGQIVQRSYVGPMNASSKVSLSTSDLSSGSYILEVSSYNQKWNQLLMIYR